MVFIITRCNFLSLRCTIEMALFENISERIHCSLVVHQLKHAQCFCRQFLQTLAEFEICRLFFKCHFCIWWMRRIRVHRHALSGKSLHSGCTSSSPHLTFYVPQRHDKIVPLPFIPNWNYQNSLRTLWP